MISNVRRINLETPKNLRELGGYMRKDGKITKFQEFLRGDCMSGLLDTEIDFLKSYGLKTVIDLRTDTEALREPNSFKNVKDVNFIEIPLFENNTPFISDDFSLGDLYMYIMDNSLNFGTLFNYMADNSEGTILYHCTAGKDRTGIVTCLLYMLADIDRCDIVADYEVSFTYFKQALAKELEINPDMPLHFAHSKSQWMEAFINRILKEYGSAENFLSEKGVSEKNIEILKNKII
ncbi:tyrosine-protein phosphatase [Anaeropeptidivorans aminofermentans]|uniref:tyrosine-protein phosphatase n=1 Tax=Anaeropeptidivorans aminofermentans TaxID=2934315 RepID=UPI0020243A28|nr:tyrosine-protein phosphatase [Anaeropeptidivorans aminofermentans]